ncbi:mitochondrial carrier domain-containing protein [Melampsora americana]|nr:mitochondrial carrier domain-containing protein [Melampsora americana]
MAVESQAQVIKDLLAGTVGGITQVLVGQPFDIVKVRLQSSDAYRGMNEAALRILREEGPASFYKGCSIKFLTLKKSNRSLIKISNHHLKKSLGTTLPLLGIGACVSIQFAFLEGFKRSFRRQNLASGQNEELTLGQLYLSGGGAGVANSIISGPVEHIRIRLQTSSPTAQNRLQGPLDALKQIYKTDGIRGWYQGQGATVLREFHGYGMYFLGYEWLVQRHINQNGGTRKDLGTGWAMLYGAGAGYSMWLCSYPLDQIKTRIQTDGLPSQLNDRKYYGVVDCAKKVWRAEGVKGFTKGLAPTLLRSPLVNGATFAAFETTMKLLS